MIAHANYAMGHRYSIRLTAFFLLLTVLVLTTTLCSSAMRTQTSKENILVKKDTWTAVSMHGLPRGANLSVKIRSSGRIRILFLDKMEFDRFPNSKNSYFDDISNDDLTFNIAITKADEYFLVLDNRNVTQDTLVHIIVTGSITR